MTTTGPLGVTLSTSVDVSAFYGELLGWTCAGGAWIDEGGTPVAAAAVSGEGGWAPVFDVGVAQVIEAGGKAHGDEPSVTDGGGVAFRVAPAPVPLAPPGPGRPVWFEHMSTDPDAADAFYGELLGWTSAPAGPGYALFATGGPPVAGRLELPSELSTVVGARWMIYIAFGDVDSAADSLGDAVLVPPRDTPTGRLCAVKDPGGAVFTLLTPA